MKIRITETQYKLLIEQKVSSILHYAKNLDKFPKFKPTKINIDFDIPKVDVPKVDVPKVDVPKVDVPKVDANTISIADDIQKLELPRKKIESKLKSGVIDLVTDLDELVELKKSYYAIFNDYWNKLYKNINDFPNSDKVLEKIKLGDISWVSDLKNSPFRGEVNEFWVLLKTTEDELNDLFKEFKFKNGDDFIEFFEGSKNYPNVSSPESIDLVVSVLKNKNIDYKSLDKFIKELGIKEWGTLTKPEWRTFDVGGKPINFRFGSKGIVDTKSGYFTSAPSPDVINIIRNWSNEFNNIKPDLTWPQFLESKFFENYEPLKKLGVSYDDWFTHYSVSGGVHQSRTKGNGVEGAWITLNPNANFAKSKERLYNQVVWVIDHEIGHVDQKSSISKINTAKYDSTIGKKSISDINKHMNSKINTGEVVGYEVDWEGLGEKTQKIILDDYHKQYPNTIDDVKFDTETGKIINADFLEYCLNRLNSSNMSNYITSIETQTPIFKNWEKSRAYKYYIKTLSRDKKVINFYKGRVSIEDLLSMNDANLVKFVENNATADKFVESVLRKSAEDLSYFSNPKEIEAEFSALIKNIIRTGSQKEQKGFITWLENYLRSSNKEELLKGDSYLTKFVNKLKGNYSNPLGKNNSGWADLDEILRRLEGPNKSIYPNQTKKLYSDIYKQIQELKSVGINENFKMKIRITESQLKRVLNEVGGYDDKDIMSIHAQSVQSPLLQTLATTVEILNTFIEMSMSGNLENKQMITNFISNLTHKLTIDIDMINNLENEIYLDNDFKNLIGDYKLVLKKLQNYLRLLYSGDTGLSYDMTKQELVMSILNQIESMEGMMSKMSMMFGDVHDRYRNRLGLN